MQDIEADKEREREREAAEAAAEQKRQLQLQMASGYGFSAPASVGGVAAMAPMGMSAPYYVRVFLLNTNICSRLLMAFGNFQPAAKAVQMRLIVWPVDLQSKTRLCSSVHTLTFTARRICHGADEQYGPNDEHGADDEYGADDKYGSNVEHDERRWYGHGHAVANVPAADVCATTAAANDVPGLARSLLSCRMSNSSVVSEQFSYLHVSFLCAFCGWARVSECSNKCMQCSREWAILDFKRRSSKRDQPLRISALFSSLVEFFFALLLFSLFAAGFRETS